MEAPEMEAETLRPRLRPRKGGYGANFEAEPRYRCKNLFYHAVLIIGYGTTNSGVDYYECQNTDGDTWGDEGYGKIARRIFLRYSYPLDPKIVEPKLTRLSEPEPAPAPAPIPAPTLIHRYSRRRRNQYIQIP